MEITKLNSAKEGAITAPENQKEETAQEMAERLQKEVDAYKEMVSTIINEFGSIDVLVNNAGIVYDRSFSK